MAIRGLFFFSFFFFTGKLLNFLSLSLEVESERGLLRSIMFSRIGSHRLSSINNSPNSLKRLSVCVCVCVCGCVCPGAVVKGLVPLNAHHGAQTKESQLIQQNKSFVCVCVCVCCVCAVEVQCLTV